MGRTEDSRKVLIEGRRIRASKLHTSEQVKKRTAEERNAVSDDPYLHGSH
jgi:hypothetical protein